MVYTSGRFVSLNNLPKITSKCNRFLTLYSFPDNVASRRIIPLSSYLLNINFPVQFNFVNVDGLVKIPRSCCSAAATFLAVAVQLALSWR